MVYAGLEDAYSISIEFCQRSPEGVFFMLNYLYPEQNPYVTSYAGLR